MLPTEFNHAIFLDIEDFQEDINDCQRRIIREPRSIEAHYRLGNAYYRQQQLGNALNAYQSALLLDPNLLSVKLYTLIGDISYQQKEFEKASIFYQKVIILEPTFAAGAYWNLGNIWYQEGRIGEANFCKNKATELLPELKNFFVRPITFEYLPGGWATEVLETGYDTQERLQSTLESWRVPFQPDARPLGIPKETDIPTSRQYATHNMTVAYAYVLALACLKKDFLSILDWGGGGGGHYFLSKNLLPDVVFDYHIRELPLLCQEGRKWLAEIKWYDNDEECFQRDYDLVIASGSLQYVENWQEVTRRLASVTRSFLFITRLAVVYQNPSFVTLQRAPHLGMISKFWCLNHKELMSCLLPQMRLVREFLIDDYPIDAQGAPEIAPMQGFLLQPTLK